MSSKWKEVITIILCVAVVLVGGFMMFLIIGCGDGGEDNSEASAEGSALCPNPNQIPVGVDLLNPFTLEEVEWIPVQQGAAAGKLHHVFVFSAFNAEVKFTFIKVIDLGGGQTQEIVMSTDGGGVEDGSVTTNLFQKDVIVELVEGNNLFKVALEVNYVDECWQDTSQTFQYTASRQGSTVTITIEGGTEEGTEEASADTDGTTGEETEETEGTTDEGTEETDETTAGTEETGESSEGTEETPDFYAQADIYFVNVLLAEDGNEAQDVTWVNYFNGEVLEGFLDATFSTPDAFLWLFFQSDGPEPAIKLTQVILREGYALMITDPGTELPLQPKGDGESFLLGPSLQVLMEVILLED